MLEKKPIIEQKKRYIYKLPFSVYIHRHKIKRSIYSVILKIEKILVIISNK